jgi:hypothetical protein
MWWLFGLIGAVVWVGLLVTVGIVTLRNHHFILFVLGLMLPVLWIVGALWVREPAPAGS